MRPALLAVALFVGPACNPCQQVCDRMAAYARECGYAVPPSEVAACRAEQSDRRDDHAVCRQQGTRAGIRDTWTCEDVGAYFDRVRGPAALDTADPDTAW